MKSLSRHIASARAQCGNKLDRMYMAIASRDGVNLEISGWQNAPKGLEQVALELHRLLAPRLPSQRRSVLTVEVGVVKDAISRLSRREIYVVAMSAGAVIAINNTFDPPIRSPWSGAYCCLAVTSRAAQSSAAACSRY